ncbi:putative N6-adenine methyltransferase-domain-containing protein [Gautieria morchelliformis]|nr:putative N6-adenine methyltransferase-domain-containing protein [Gautieria morchelliformis]
MLPLNNTHSHSFLPNSADLPELDCGDIDARQEIPISNLFEDQKEFDCSDDETKGFGSSEPQGIPIDKFKRVFKELAAQSVLVQPRSITLQIWHGIVIFNVSLDTAGRLAQAVKLICPINARVAFMCCPTGYVSFKEIALPTQTTLLLEYDRRFSIVAGSNFVHYDLDHALSFLHAEDLGGSQDVVVVDPPFHSEVSQKKIALTVAHILRPGGRLVLLTGVMLSSLIDSIYRSPLPKLRRRDIVIEHDGVGRLATPYGCWTGGGPDDEDEVGFGGPINDEP